MMREAQKLMKDPAFQAQCRKMMQGGAFQNAMQQTKQDMKDPEKVKAMEEKTKKAIEEGEKELAALRAAKEAKGDGVDDDDAKPEASGKQQKENATATDEAPDDIDEMPDMPSLQIN